MTKTFCDACGQDYEPERDLEGAVDHNFYIPLLKPDGSQLEAAHVSMTVEICPKCVLVSVKKWVEEYDDPRKEVGA